MTRPLSFDLDAAASLQALVSEVPVLARLRRFALGLEAGDWFARLGEPPGRQLHAAARQYLDQLGFPAAQLAILPHFDDALGAAETHDWASPAWEAEEQLRAALTSRALEIVTDEALELGLRLVAQHAAEAGEEAAAQAIAMWDAEAAGAADLLVGALAQAVHGAGLLLVAAAADPDIDATGHAFAARLRMFQLGRWPVGVIGDSFNVF